MDGQEKIFLRLYNDFFRSGMAAELGPQRAITLLAIASYMDEDGVACPSQKTLGRDLGISEEMVGKHIRVLLETRWNGQPILQRKKVQVKGAKRYQYYSVYTISPVAQIARFYGEVVSVDGPGQKEPFKKSMSNEEWTSNKVGLNNKTVNYNNSNNSKDSNNSNKRNNSLIAKKGKEIETDDFQIKNSRDVCIYFANKYEQKYEVPYSVNWKRDASMVKTKLWGTYTPEQLRAIIDVIMEEYDTRWRTRDYLRPSIGQLCTWLGNKAMAVVQDREKERADLKQREEEARAAGATMEDLERWLNG
ncbi:MAG: helix-turn-helix domain-containing protein [Firmicutes bacterium]|nr:helix-turn-helix domain-containing protein [Bacillota bacterium]